jgi:hypothetical protein
MKNKMAQTPFFSALEVRGLFFFRRTLTTSYTFLQAQTPRDSETSRAAMTVETPERSAYRLDPGQAIRAR